MNNERKKSWPKMKQKSLNAITLQGAIKKKSNIAIAILEKLRV